MNFLPYVVAIAPAMVVLSLAGLYPLLLRFLSRRALASAGPTPPGGWPRVTVVIAAHNAAEHLGATLSAIADDDYPADRRTILVVSDASTDATAEIVRRSGVARVVELRRRMGKTAAENRVARHVRGDVVVCMDAHVVIERGTLRALVAALAHPDVGVASATDVAVGSTAAVAAGEQAYIHMEMALRRLESETIGLVGASGCLYAMRRQLFVSSIRATHARDFATVLLARRQGLRTVVAEGARCRIRSARSARPELARKSRTLLQGMSTLRHFRDLMDPRRHGWFAVGLLIHKVGRWLLPLLIIPAVVAIALLAADAVTRSDVGALVLAVGALLALAIAFFLRAPLTYALVVQCAALDAWRRFAGGEEIAYWSPTLRVGATGATPDGEPGRAAARQGRGARSGSTSGGAGGRAIASSE